MAAVLVVNDDPAAAELERRLLARAGHSATMAVDRDQALKLMASDAPSCVVLDLTSGGIGENLAVLDAIRAAPDPSIAEVPVVLISHRTSGSLPSWEAGIDGFLSRPFAADELVQLVATAIARPEAERVLLRHRRVTPGHSP